MPLESHILSDLFLHIPPKSDQALSGLTHQQPLRIIFFVTGNPGLIGYYHAFLSLLADSEEARGCVVLGASLGGFEIEGNLKGGRNHQGDRSRGDDVDVGELMFPRGKGMGERREEKLWGLREQVELCMVRVDELVRRVQGDDGFVKDPEGVVVGVERRPLTKVILVGHSVGAWIALEMVGLSRSLWKERLERGESDVAGVREQEVEVGTGKGTLGIAQEDGMDGCWEVEAAMLLTPTIMDLPLSRSGRIAGPLLGNVPYLPEIAQWGCTGVRWLLGEQGLRRVVSSVTGIREDEGSGLDTTVNFLLSGRGVQQSLSLARDELRIIREDEWGEDVWGILDEDGRENGKTDHVGLAAGTRVKRPRLYFLFAEKDHWVADETRKKISEKRGMERRYVVDEEGLQHAWCLRQNKEVADRVREWLREISAPAG